MYPQIYNSSGERLAVLDNIVKDSASIKRVVNGEFTFAFKAFEKELKSEYFDPNNSILIDNQTFDIKYIEQKHETEVVYEIQCEHVNYRLADGASNLYPSYVYTGTPSQILTNILSGTGFSVGTVSYGGVMTLTVNAEINKKNLIYELVNSLGGEIEYTNNGFSINILNTIGQDVGFQARFGKNLKGLSKIIDNRGGLKTYYDVDIVALKNSNEYIEKQLQDLEVIGVGDTIQIIDEVIGLNVQNRIISITYNPIFELNTKLEIANTIESITSTITKIEKSKIEKEAIYNGCKIGPDDGFVAERSDGKAKTVMNATEGISIYSDKGSGLVRNFYVDTNGFIQGKGLEIDDASFFYGKVAVTNGYTDIVIDPDGAYPFKINYFTRDIFRVDTAGNADLKQVTLRNDLVGSNYLNISPSGMYAWDNSNSRKSFEIDSSGKAYFRGDITSDAVITGATIRSGAVGTNRIELSSGSFKGIHSSGDLTGLVYEIKPTGIVDLFLYHNGIKLAEFYDNIDSYAIRGTSSSNGLRLGGSSAPTYFDGHLYFGGTTIHSLVTSSGGSHSHSGDTYSSGTHNHGLSNGSSVVFYDWSGEYYYTQTWVESGSHSHSVSIYSGGSHSHNVQSN